MTTQNIVLVHGGFVDGSGWRGVYAILKRDGYHVTIVQNPTAERPLPTVGLRDVLPRDGFAR